MITKRASSSFFGSTRRPTQNQVAPHRAAEKEHLMNNCLCNLFENDYIWLIILALLIITCCCNR